jgi:hypothetical protein
MKNYKVKVTYTNGTVLVTEVKGKGKESVKEEIKRDKMYFLGYPLVVQDVEILSNKIDKKLIEKFDDQLRALGDRFLSELDFLDKATEIFEKEGFKMMHIPSTNNTGHLVLINNNEDVVENYKIYYVSTYLDDRAEKPVEVIKYNCLILKRKSPKEYTYIKIRGNSSERMSPEPPVGRNIPILKQTRTEERMFGFFFCFIYFFLDFVFLLW